MDPAQPSLTADAGGSSPATCANMSSRAPSRRAGSGTRRTMPPLLLLVVLGALLLPTAMAADEIVTWVRNHPQGGKPYDQLQCQTVTVNWGGDSLPHSLYEFRNEDDWKNCNFLNAWLLVGPQTTGSYVIGPGDNLTPGKKWYASDVSDDCTNARMKFSVKTRPLLQDKFAGYECEGDFGAEDVTVKNAADIKECRKICKRRRGCVAIQFVGGGKGKCRLFSKLPFRAVRKNEQTFCEVAAASCDPNDRSPIQVVEKPDDQEGCVFCNNHRSPAMLERGSLCDSCGSCRPELCTSRSGYCEFSCWITGYDIGKKCCDISAQKPDAGKSCQECTNHRTQFMVENGYECATYNFAFTDRCSNTLPADPITGLPWRSWWLDSPIQYCQYSCWKNGVGFQGKTIFGEHHVGQKANQFPMTFDPRPCCDRSDETDTDLFPVSIKK